LIIDCIPIYYYYIKIKYPQSLIQPFDFKVYLITGLLFLNIIVCNYIKVIRLVYIFFVMQRNFSSRWRLKRWKVTFVHSEDGNPQKFPGSELEIPQNAGRSACTDTKIHTMVFIRSKHVLILCTLCQDINFWLHLIFILKPPSTTC